MNDPAEKIPVIFGMLFQPQWLQSVDEEDPEGRTNYEIQTRASVVYISVVVLVLTNLSIPGSVCASGSHSPSELDGQYLSVGGGYHT